MGLKEKEALAFWLAVAGSESPGALDKLAMATEKEMILNALNEALRIARTEKARDSIVYRKLKNKINAPEPGELAQLVERVSEQVELAHEVAALAQSFILLADTMEVGEVSGDED